MDNHGVVVFHLELLCEETGLKTFEDITFPSLPRKAITVKEDIEDHFSIPRCVQTLYHNSSKILDTDDLRSLYLRNGDTFQVSYPSKGDCDLVTDVIVWLNELVSVFSSMHVTSEGHQSHYEFFGEIYPKFLQLTSYDRAEHRYLRLTLFYPWGNKTKYVNKLQFDSLGGVEILMKLYRHLIQMRRSNSNMDRRCYLEAVCSQSIANYAETFPFRRCILEHGGLEFCIETFLVTQVGLNSLFTDDAIEVSLYALCNLSELPECKLLLSKRNDVIEQALGIAGATRNRFSCNTAVVSLSLILCVSQHQEACTTLLIPEVISRILQLCEARRTESLEYQGDHQTVRGLYSYSATTFAQLILSSTNHHLVNFSKELLEEMSAALDSVSRNNPKDLQELEIKDGYVWQTFLPYMNSLYAPVEGIDCELFTGEMAELIRRLKDLSASVLLYSLHVAFGREIHVKVLIEEGLLDYLIILPYHVVPELREKAKKVVQEVSKFTPIKPPMLCTLARAKLAKSSLGLSVVLQTDSITLYDILQHTSNFN